MGKGRGPGRPRNDDPNTTIIMSRNEVARRIQEQAMDYYRQDDILNILDTYGQIVMDAVMEGRGVYVYGVGRIIGKRVPPRGYKIYGTNERIGVSDSYVKPTMKFLPSFDSMIKTASLVKAEDYDDFIRSGASIKISWLDGDDSEPSEEEMFEEDEASEDSDVEEADEDDDGVSDVEEEDE